MRALGGTYQSETEAVHHRPETVALTLDPGLDLLLSAARGQLGLEARQELAEGTHLGGAIFLPALGDRLGVVLRRCDEEEEGLIEELGQRLGTLLDERDDLSDEGLIVADAFFLEARTEQLC